MNVADEIDNDTVTVTVDDTTFAEDNYDADNAMLEIDHHDNDTECIDDVIYFTY